MKWWNPKTKRYDRDDDWVERPTLTRDEQKLLDLLADFGPLCMGEIQRLGGWNGKRAVEIRQSLIDYKEISIHTESTRGRPRTVVTLRDS